MVFPSSSIKPTQVNNCSLWCGETSTYPRTSNPLLRDDPDSSKCRPDARCKPGVPCLHTSGPIPLSRGCLRTWIARMTSKDHRPFHPTCFAASVSALSLSFFAHHRLTSKFQSSKRTPPCLYPLLERFTTRAPLPDARILPIISCVKRK